MTTTRALPARADVVVIGAGLSGLTAARDLVRAGVEDVVVVEARDRVGGRVYELVRPNGRTLMMGGEFTGEAQAGLWALAAEYGIDVEPMPPFADLENMGRFVRIFDGQRFVEDWPLASDPQAQEAFGAAVAAVDALAARIPADEPWTAPDAVELDRVSIGDWLDANLVNPAARAAFEAEIGSFGDPYETSMFYLAWFLACYGGWEAHGAVWTGRFVQGSSAIVAALAGELGQRVHLQAPVRTILRDDERITVRTDRGSVQCGAVIVAMEPGQAGKIDFEPALPADRDRLQARWQAGHGAKIFAIYDTPWWREDGLAGVASGLTPLPLALDLSPSEGDEGVLCALFFGSGPTLARYGRDLSSEEATRALTLDVLERYFGPKARQPKEFYVSNWEGDPWSRGCGGQVPTGTLSTVGATLRRPIGRIVFAGAETGATDFMEGAVTSGQRAAREARQLLA